MKIKVTLILLLIAVRTATFAAELAPPDRAALLEKLHDNRAKFPSMQAVFVEEKKTHLLTRPVTSEGTMSFQAPDKFRREVKGKSPSVTVCDGKTMWIYYPNFKEAEQYILGQRAMLDDSLAALTAGLNYQRIDEFYKYTAFRDEAGYRLVLTPKRPNLKRVVEQLTVTMDDELQVQKTELLLPKGDRLLTTYKNPRLSALPSSTFVFTPPADAHVSHPLGK